MSTNRYFSSSAASPALLIFAQRFTLPAIPKRGRSVPNEGGHRRLNSLRDYRQIRLSTLGQKSRDPSLNGIALSSPIQVKNMWPLSKNCLRISLITHDLLLP